MIRHRLITSLLFITLNASASAALEFVEPATNVTVEQDTELRIVVANSTGESAAVFLISDAKEREIFSAAEGVTGYVLDLAGYRPGEYTLEARVDDGRTEKVSFTVAGTGAAAGLPKVYPLPNPFDLSTLSGEVTFINLPSGSVVTVFDMSGKEVIKISGRSTWNGRNARGDLVSSGTYLYHISTPDGSTSTGKLAVVK